MTSKAQSNFQFLSISFFFDHHHCDFVKFFLSFFFAVLCAIYAAGCSYKVCTFLSYFCFRLYMRCVKWAVFKTLLTYILAYFGGFCVKVKCVTINFTLFFCRKISKLNSITYFFLFTACRVNFNANKKYFLIVVHVLIVSTRVNFIILRCCTKNENLSAI